MFCKKCGLPLPSGTNFCTHCGTAVTPPAPTGHSNTSEIAPPPIVPGSASSSERVEKHMQATPSSSFRQKVISYYEVQFKKIYETGKCDTDLANYWRAPLRPLYHANFILFGKTILPPLLLLLISFAMMYYDMITHATSTILFSVGAVVFMFSALWYIIQCVWLCRNYTKKLYQQVNGIAANIPFTPQGPLLFFLTLFLYCIIFILALLGNAPSQAQNSAPFEDRAVGAEANAFGDYNIAEVMLDQGVPWSGIWDGDYRLKTFQMVTYGKWGDFSSEPQEDGSYLLRYTMGNGSFEAEYVLSADGSTLTEYDEWGNELLKYSRPKNNAERPLPQEFWGYWKSKNDGSVLTIDAFRMGEYPYTSDSRTSTTNVEEFSITPTTFWSDGFCCTVLLYEDDGIVTLRIVGSDYAGEYTATRDILIDYTQPKDPTMHAATPKPSITASSPESSPSASSAISDNPPTGNNTFALTGLALGEIHYAVNGVEQEETLPTNRDGPTFIDPALFTKPNNVLSLVDHCIDDSYITYLALVGDPSLGTVDFSNSAYACDTDGYYQPDNDLIATLITWYYTSYLQSINEQSLDYMVLSTDENTQRMYERVISSANAQNTYNLDSIKVTVNSESLQILDSKTICVNATFQCIKQNRESGIVEPLENHQTVQMVWENGLWKVNHFEFVSDSEFAANQFATFSK